MNVKLTDAEIKALEDASWTGGRSAWIAAIEGIIAARIGQVEALVEEWSSLPGRPESWWRVGAQLGATLRGEAP